MYPNKRINLVLSGGGVKGIAYVGVCKTAEERAYRWKNISGVSAGALAGSFAASGFGWREMWQAMNEFEFNKVQMGRDYGKLSIVNDYMSFINENRIQGSESIKLFLSSNKNMRTWGDYYNNTMTENNRGILDNIILYSKNECLFDGDYLEEWCSKQLVKKGIRTFGDLRGGVIDKMNPRGYKLRMTGVDCNRAKSVILPDDLIFYGIDPDSFEVAKAVRISTCVPFAFKPVVLTKKENGKNKIYNLVDGGVFDKFPYWTIDKSNSPTVGFRLDGGKKKKFFSLDTALNVLKSIISAVQDIGIPSNENSYLKYVAPINTTKVSSLDFGLSDEDKEYLFDSGIEAAVLLFNMYERDKMRQMRSKKIYIPFLSPFLRRRM